MPRRSQREIASWKPFTEHGRAFIRASIPRGQNEDQTYSVAERIADRYQVKRFFASGGFGLILAGEDVRTENDVLIKTTLRYDIAIEAQGRDREGFTRKVWARRQQLQTERRIMVQLRNLGCNAIPNPNDFVFDRNPLLAGPYAAEDGQPWTYDDQGMLDTEPYLVLETIEGRTLADLLEDRFRDGMEEERALSVLRQVVGVLRLLHRPWVINNQTWQVVYQDLKPDNILLGAHDHVYLIDMGGCRVMVNERLAAEGAHTPGYCPPECTLARMPVTPAADSYALGATLYHLLTGKAPASFLPDIIRSEDEHAVAADRWDWRLLEGRASTATVGLLKACLAHAARDRPANGEALWEELKR